MKKAFGIIGVILLAVFVGPPLLQVGTDILNGAVDSATSAMLSVLPRIALGSAVLGLLLLISPWWRKHGMKVIAFAFIAAACSGVISAGMFWATEQGTTVGQTGLQVAGVIIGKVLGSFRGIG